MCTDCKSRRITCSRLEGLSTSLPTQSPFARLCKPEIFRAGQRVRFIKGHQLLISATMRQQGRLRTQTACSHSKDGAFANQDDPKIPQVCPACSSFGFLFLIMKDTLRSNGRASKCRAACSQDAIVAWQVAIVGSSPLASTWEGVQNVAHGFLAVLLTDCQCQSHFCMLQYYSTSS